MSFFNEKWKNSSILTKVSLWPMVLCTLLLLIMSFTLLSWERTIVSLAATTGASASSPLPSPWLLVLIVCLINALLTFGIFKVNNYSRVCTILIGLGQIITIILLIAGIGYVMEAAREVVGGEIVDAAVAAQKASMGMVGKLFTNIIIPLIPASVLAKIGFYVVVFSAPPFLWVISMLLLLFCGKDFKKLKNKEA